ncbi:MAG TPA: hypothetical protein VGG83_21490 [Trebonia sp.]|jgi:hypothetical protein
MRKAAVRIAGLVATASATLMLVGAGIASASPNPGPRHVTGPEIITGSAYGRAALANNPRIPLKLSGLVRATDNNFRLGGNGNTHTLSTSAGWLTVTTVGRQTTRQTLNPRSCYMTDTIRQSLVFVPRKSTGKFTGASGPGSYQVSFAAYVPRYTSGKHRGACDTNAQPLARGAVVNFHAAGVLTVVR